MCLSSVRIHLFYAMNLCWRAVYFLPSLKRRRAPLCAQCSYNCHFLLLQLLLILLLGINRYVFILVNKQTDFCPPFAVKIKMIEYTVTKYDLLKYYTVRSRRIWRVTQFM